MNLLWWVATWGGTPGPNHGTVNITLDGVTLVAYDVTPWLFGRSVRMINVSML